MGQGVVLHTPRVQDEEGRGLLLDDAVKSLVSNNIVLRCFGLLHGFYSIGNSRDRCGGNILIAVKVYFDLRALG